MEPRIRVLTTGGTIDKVYTLTGTLDIGEPAVPELLAVGRCTVPVTVEEVLRKDSLELEDADREAVVAAVRRAPEDRVVVVHGTDTMAETARFVQSRVKAKTVVLTGAMQPAAMRASDAGFNLGTAIAAVQLLAPGVYVVMNGRIFPADAVTKDRAAGVFVSGSAANLRT